MTEGEKAELLRVAGAARIAKDEAAEKYRYAVVGAVAGGCSRGEVARAVGVGVMVVSRMCHDYFSAPSVLLIP